MKPVSGIQILLTIGFLIFSTNVMVGDAPLDTDLVEEIDNEGSLPTTTKATSDLIGNTTRYVETRKDGDEKTMTLLVFPKIDSINLSAFETFGITITSDGEQLGGVGLDIRADRGTISEVMEIGGGEYSFTYSAPDDEGGKTEVVRIDAEKDGYEDARVEFSFTIGSGGGGPARETTLDGIVSDGEYGFSASFKGGEVTVHWEIQDATIAMAVVGKTPGWVALGLDPSRSMKDSDMIIGWVDTSGVHVVDAYSTGATGPHPSDTDLGGTDDLLYVGGSEGSGVTTIEFIRNLEATDQYDKTIPTKGDLKIIWATGSSDSFGNQHSKTTRGTGTITIDTGQSSEEDKTALWPFHAIFMTLGLASMLTAIFIAKYKKNEARWLAYHKRLGIAGAVMTIIGLTIGFYMIADSTGEHFRVPHALLGLVTIILAISTPIIGLSMFKFIKYINKMKPLHRWLGRVTATLMILTVLSGLGEAGVIFS